MRTTLLCIILAVLTLLLFFASLFHGTADYSAAEVWQALTGSDATSTAAYIVRWTRLPQAVTAMLVGAALATSGLILQTVFTNPLADSSILGINSGASLGVAVVMLLGGGTITAGSFALSGFLAILTMAFLGAALIIGMLLLFSRVMKSSVMLLILGIMVSYLTSSVISLLNYVATSEGVHSYIVWGLGNFSGVPLDHLLPFSLVVIAALAAAVALIKPLNAILLGENYAANLGVNLRRTRTLLLLITGVLTAISTAYCGPISFLGLAVPHMARLSLGTANHRALLPVTLLLGALIALLCNAICNLPGDSGLIPLNVVTPFFGVPIILYILVFKRRHVGL